MQNNMKSPNQNMRHRLTALSSMSDDIDIIRLSHTSADQDDKDNDTDAWTADVVDEDCLFEENKTNMSDKQETRERKTSSDANDDLFSKKVHFTSNETFCVDTNEDEDIENDSDLMQISASRNYDIDDWMRRSRQLRLSKISELSMAGSSLVSHTSVAMPDLKEDDHEIKQSDSETLASDPKLQSILKPVKPKFQRLHTVLTMSSIEIQEHQIIENVLQNARCCCCDSQIGLTMAFIWLIMCCMPHEDIRKNWLLTIISLIQVMCMFMGIIGIWKAAKVHLWVAQIGMFINIGFMVVRMISLIFMHFNSKESFLLDIDGDYFPPFIVIPRTKIGHLSTLWLQWILIVLTNIALQAWIIWHINRALVAIRNIHKEFLPADHDPDTIRL